MSDAPAPEETIVARFPLVGLGGLHAVECNPFAVQLLAESFLRMQVRAAAGGATVPNGFGFEFAVDREDCPGFSGVRIYIEAVPAEVEA